MAEGTLSSLSPSPTYAFEDLANRPVNRALTTASACLSMLGTLTIVATFIAWKDVRSVSRRILVYISLADFLIAGSNLYGLWLEKYSDEVECKSQSFVTTCACLCSFFWTTFLAVFIYTAVAWKNVNTAEKTLKVFFPFGWGIPLLVTGIALSQDALGNDSDLYSAGWCWISSTVRNKTMWMWITGKAWEIAAYILISVFYGLLKCHIRRQVCYQQKHFRTQRSIADALKAERRLTFVPVIFILLRIWGTIRFIIFTTTKPASYRRLLDVLLYLQGIGDSGQGFANFILFCLLTEKFQFHLRMMAHKCKLCVSKPVMVLQQNSTASDAHDKQPSTTNHQRPIRETTPLIKGI